jgi:aminoglycoside phosphotransferase (APT) family kinase protein
MPRDFAGQVRCVLNADSVVEEARAVLDRTVGIPFAFDRVMGVGGPGIAICRGPKGRAVIKSTSALEYAFYRDWAPLLRRDGLGIPRVLGCGSSGSGHWLVMEWLPRVAGPGSPVAMADQVRYLAWLHEWSVGRGAESAAPLPARPVALQLHDAEAAASLWQGADAARLMTLLTAAWPKVEGHCLVSGDPNPTNWGWRANGELVLFDWGEVGRGHPAYDLPILCDGLPGAQDLRQVARSYLAARGEGHGRDEERWVAWMATARLVSFVHFLAAWSRGDVTTAARRGVRMLQDNLIAWIAGMCPLVAPFADGTLVLP